MDGKRIASLAASLLLGLGATIGRAEEPLWHAVTLQAPAPVAKPVPTTPSQTSGPAVTIGRPIAVGQSAEPSPLPYLPSAAVQRVNYNDVGSSAGEQPSVVRCEAPDIQPLSGPPPVPPPPPPPPPSPTYGDTPYNPGVAIDHPLNKSFGDQCREFLGFNSGGANSGCNRAPFQSDHAFDGLISPVSNPFYFEDPRSLTELRPIFMWQSVPHKDPYFMGGNVEFFGVQGRLALNEHWSVVVNKLGWIGTQPDNPDLRHTSTFADVNLGPKWTFFRNEEGPGGPGIAATGINFDIPTSKHSELGASDTLGLDPYITYGKNFGHLPNGYGSFNFLGEAGFSFGVNNSRSDFFHTSLHLDYDVANLHKIYPLMELNWFYYLKHGNNSDITTEGADLINFGAEHLEFNRNVVRLAFGFRYKFSECLQLGTAFEFPVTNQKALSDFRLGIDLIWRY